jgi:phosphohistidine swiveling domain-containing protein
MRTRYVLDLRDARPRQGIGNKARKLQFLVKKGFRTPATWVCTWDAYSRYIEGEPQIIDAVRSEIASTVDSHQGHAIRSSANVEDSKERSFAGQFKTVLDIHGVNDILHSVRSIWDSTRSPGVQRYLERTGMSPGDLKMAVIIQQMVNPVISGVAFSRNPMTGLDEVTVEAVEGVGTALVQEGVTPERWINKWGAWIARPEQERISIDLIQEVVSQTKEIASIYGRAVDLEWVHDGHTLHWVQLREITALDHVNIYSNHISKEFLPGIIKPLVWSVNVPLVNGAWIRLIAEVIGDNDLDPDSLAKPFYYRAYFNMGAFGQIFETLGLPRESLELLMGIELGGPEKPSFKPTPRTLRFLPRMLRFAAHKSRFARQVKAFLPAAQKRYQAFRVGRLDQLNADELITQIDRLYALTQETAYYNIVTPLLMQLYNRLLQRQLNSAGVDFSTLDVTRGMDELQEFDPNSHLARLHQEYCALDNDRQGAIDTSSYVDFRRLQGIDAFQGDVERFIRQFGHLSDSGNDFSSVPWQENPDVILKMITNYSAHNGGAAPKVAFEELALPFMRRPLTHAIYRRARKFRLYREAVSFLYTFGYGLFRTHFLNLGDHLVGSGHLESREDIFFLSVDEVREIVQQRTTTDHYANKIVQRKHEIELYRDVTPPSIIYGDQPLPLDTNTGDKLKGTPTSGGYYQGRVKVVRGIQDFEKLLEGDVLVIPYSDVGWTPLFTKAGAVIAESGGILSHSSIIAREYNIPAVVSVFGACNLEDNTLVTVDGYRGEITCIEPRGGNDLWTS